MEFLDAVQGIGLDQSLGGNELFARNRLAIGLAYLNQSVAKLDQHARSVIGERETLLFGNIGEFLKVPKERLDLLPSQFHWYATLSFAKR
jgi:hypothetical protein